MDSGITSVSSFLVVLVFMLFAKKSAEGYLSSWLLTFKQYIFMLCKYKILQFYVILTFNFVYFKSRIPIKLR